MVKKRMSKQNVMIIILSVLLLLSLIFGATYAYFSGSSNTLTSGYITTAVLNVNLNPADEDGNVSSDEFQLEVTEDKRKNVVPGQPLTNTALQVTNTSPVATYMVVTYSLKLGTKEEAEDAPQTYDVMNLRGEAVGAGWSQYVYTCKDGQSKISTLVYLGSKFDGRDVELGYGDGIFSKELNDDKDYTKVLNSDCLIVPYTWDNEMQGKTIFVTFTAYVLQVQGLSANYPDVTNVNVETRKQAIAKAVISEFSLDKTTSPSA